MVIEQICQEIREALRLHRCRHKACDCYKARELLAVLEAVSRVKHPWQPELKLYDDQVIYDGHTVKKIP